MFAGGDSVRSTGTGTGRDGTGRRLPSPAQLADGDDDRHISSIRSSGRRYPSPRPLTSHAKEPPVLPLQSVCLGYAGVFLHLLLLQFAAFQFQSLHEAHRFAVSSFSNPHFHAKSSYFIVYLL